LQDFWVVKKAIGERIRKIRLQKDYTQDNMAAELEITPGAYAKIERGETDPSATRLLRIAEVLEVDVMRFFQDPENNALRVSESASSYGYASKKELEQLEQMIRQLSTELEKLRAEMTSLKKGKK
jgi:transcriptional regulator with XRE-family HTH domain